MRLLSPLAAACLLALAAAPAQAEVFINELHYDDSTAAGDVGEAIEVVATAEDLSGYRLYLYNGSNPSAAAVYANNPVPAVRRRGQLPDQRHPERPQRRHRPGRCQRQGGPVPQLRGRHHRLRWPCRRMTSQNIPVAETNSTAAGTSLQLTGSGSQYTHFTWAESARQTFGSCNNGQTFSGGGTPGPNTPPSVSTTTPAQGSSTFPAAADLEVVFSETVNLASGAFALSCGTSGSVPLTFPASGRA